MCQNARPSMGPEVRTERRSLVYNHNHCLLLVMKNQDLRFDHTGNARKLHRIYPLQPTICQEPISQEQHTAPVSSVKNSTARATATTTKPDDKLSYCRRDVKLFGGFLAAACCISRHRYNAPQPLIHVCTCAEQTLTLNLATRNDVYARLSAVCQ